MVKKPIHRVLLFFIIWGILALVFGFTDLSISNALINQQSSWARILDIFGEHPPMIIAFVSANILFNLAGHENTKKKIFMWVINSILMILTGFMIAMITIYRIFEATPSGLQNIISFILIIIAIVIIQSLLKRVDYEKLNQFRRAAVISIVTVFAVNIFINVIKPIWGRIRPRDLVGDQSNYFPWYAPQKFQSGKSFPSGHAGNSFSTLLLVLFAEKFNKKAVNWAWGIGTFWGILVSISRVVIGAHFPSDVLFGGFIAISIIYINSNIFKEKTVGADESTTNSL